jgi:hypothetical protein
MYEQFIYSAFPIAISCWLLATGLIIQNKKVSLLKVHFEISQVENQISERIIKLTANSLWLMG